MRGFSGAGIFDVEPAAARKGMGLLAGRRPVDALDLPDDPAGPEIQAWVTEHGGRIAVPVRGAGRPPGGRGGIRHRPASALPRTRAAAAPQHGCWASRRFMPFSPGACASNPEEAVHFIQYGALGVLLFRAFSHRMRDPMIYLAAALARGHPRHGGRDHPVDHPCAACSTCGTCG